MNLRKTVGKLLHKKERESLELPGKEIHAPEPEPEPGAPVASREEYEIPEQNLEHLPEIPEAKPLVRPGFKSGEEVERELEMRKEPEDIAKTLELILSKIETLDQRVKIIEMKLERR